MPVYSDDDYDDDNGPMDFQDEAEFDDYLNDEEYDLINDVLPTVKKEMADYQGWNNLNLKLALFDHEFDTQAALSHLKKTFKKKKVLKEVTKPVATTTNKKNTAKKIEKDISKLNIQDKKDSAASLDWLDEEDEEEARPKKTNEPVIRTYKKVSVPTKPRKPVNVTEYLPTAKPHLSFVVLGHVDAGKSTLMGRLLYDIGAVNSNQIRKLKKESEQIGKGSFHLAWVMDQTTEERERGVTVSICTSDFETEKANFTIVDAPGHRDFVPNAIAGVSQADVAVLSIDCGTDAFESGFNLDGQTKEHTLLAKSMDVNNVIVAMNKMDSVNWSLGRYLEIQGKLSHYFEEVGFSEDQIKWVPCSGFSGEGVYKIPYPKEQYWYTGESLVQTLEDVAIEISKESVKEVVGFPFLFSILEVIPSKKNEEAIITGKLGSGSIQPGETITLYPSEQSVVVDKILMGKEQNQVPIAIKGDFVTLKLRHAHPEDIQGGDLGASVDYNVSASQKFTLQVLTFKMDRPLLPGTSFMLFRGVCEQPARVSKLVSTVDKRDPSKIIKKKIRHLSSNQAAIIEVELTERRRWIPMLTFNENKHLGRVVLRKDGRTIAAGAVLQNN
ncbi:ribosome dissociation factor GTPase HBS1 NDAI_0A03230 [Naumovozyma dairenensis CBS 421]|uniref:Elongation factor 1 alpha-like protein n=1 Tax=Naumovozyma dairenensis (strain ATCC 10597 / BCRC 20456 / CBS 421 / NBRC 0211 / NRRL Y-12639) TaxID=1071378 RepID=G0W3U2_NAUDC|nr:hypothetical protein NDAI_0A03230 [Naumovozyma dairenensis CBS 421]CCD22480.1 hypothetical protein NDAI_0A03230 [Naumovozyma dairenensis CBS 421]